MGNYNIKFIISTFVLLFIILSSNSCREEKKSFTSNEYQIIDSLYKIKKKAIKTKLDSLCDSVYNSEYLILIDSIKIIRKKEILDLIE